MKQAAEQKLHKSQSIKKDNTNNTWIIRPRRPRLHRIEEQEFGFENGWVYQEEGYNIFSSLGLSSVHVEDRPFFDHLQDGDRIIMFDCGDIKNAFNCSSNVLCSMSIDSDCFIIGAFDNTIIQYQISHHVFCLSPQIKVFMKNLTMIPWADYEDKFYVEQFKHNKWCVVDDEAELILDDCSIDYNYGGISLSKSASISATHCEFKGQGEAISAIETSNLIHLENCCFETETSCIGILADHDKATAKEITLKFNSKGNVFKSTYYPIVSETKNYIDHFPKLHKFTYPNIWRNSILIAGGDLIESIETHDEAGLSHDHELKRINPYKKIEICECGKCGKLIYTCDAVWHCCVRHCRHYNCAQCVEFQ